RDAGSTDGDRGHLHPVGRRCFDAFSPGASVGRLQNPRESASGGFSRRDPVATGPDRMRRPTKLVLLGFVLIMGQPAHGNTGQHWCPLYGYWDRDIPVYINTDIAGLMLHTDSTPWTSDEFLREVQLVIQKFNNVGAWSGLPRIYFAGWEPHLT